MIKEKTMDNLMNYYKIDMTKSVSNTKNTFKGKHYRITILSDVLIRFEYSKDGIFNDFPTLFAINRKFNELELEIKEDEKYLFIKNKYFTLEYTKESEFYSGRLMPDANLRVTLTGTDKIWYYNHPEVRNFLSTSSSLDNYNGKIKLRKGLYSEEGFATIDDSKNLIIYNDGTIRNNPSKGIDLYLFIYKDNFGLALKSYFDLTGYPTLIPRYALGIWWNKNDEYNENNINELIHKFKNTEIPFSVLLLDSKWSLNSNSYTFNRKQFNDPKRFINNLKTNGIHLGLGINTNNKINANDEKYNDFKTSIASNEESLSLNIYDTNNMIMFLSTIIDNLNNYGVYFYSINDKTNDNVKLNILNHYLYLNYRKYKGKRPMILSRNYFTASHRYSILNSGETFVNWKTLKYLPYYNASASNIGISWWSHPIGGFKEGIEDSELYLRYIQLGVYSPIFRLASEEGKYYKREVWKWDYKTLKICKDYMRMRHRLIPYLYTEAYKYSKYGNTLIQPLYYKYPKLYDEPLYKNEYFFGTELFISPITDAKDNVMNRVVHRIFLPNGEWYDFKTGKKFSGGKRYVTFYKDEDYPVFAKGGSIIPLAVLENNINNTNPPQTLEIQIFPGRSNQYILYEDDGVSATYQEGFYISTSIAFNYSKDTYNVIIKPIDGKSNVISNIRNYKIKFRNTKKAESIITTINKSNVNNKNYASDNDFIIEIPNVPTISELNITIKSEILEIEALRALNEELDEIISDLRIETALKEKIAKIIFSNLEVKRKRIAIRKLRSEGLNRIFIKMFLKLLEYIAEI
jgi:alpha-glucosidase (family GH31 glycosyl hydrolase)